MLNTIITGSGSYIPSDTKNEVSLNDEAIYLKMRGHQIYKYGIKVVPKVVKESLDKA